MKFFRILQAVLREIFEESAYERYCAREGVDRNRVSYARFLHDTESSRGKKIRCC
jgi:hypothetical protein